MRRILIIDDNPPDFLDELKGDARDEDGEPELLHINPSDHLGKVEDAAEVVKNVVQQIGTAAREFWDVVAIDLFLGDFGVGDDSNREVPLQLAEAFREANRSAALLLYSGTLADYIDKLLGAGGKDTQLRRIFNAEVANFVPRSRIVREVVSAADNPSWLLRVDRLLMKYSTFVVAPEEAEFRGRSFTELATAVRRQDGEGQRIAQLTTEYGVSAFVDLNL